MTPEAPDHTTALTCEGAAPLLHTYVAKELGRDDTLRLRSHLARCPECMAAYRDAVETTAALGKQAGAVREQRMAERQRVARAAKALGKDLSKTPRKRNFRLRIVLIPAVVIYVILQLTNLGPPPGKVTMLSAEGGVTIGEREPDFALGPPLVLPGRWIFTKDFGKAVLEGGSCTVDVGRKTQLLVESARPVRFRLRAGQMRVVGTANVVTVLGMVQFEEGRGVLTFDDHGLFVEAEAGSITMLTPDGPQRLDLGRKHQFTMEL
ncbi:MAG: zf-HC2 domain-containing protein [Planctomycetes bacterium]|nr:zf-HC2 domain-containing protein [Planctomycetota bacterium]